MLPTVPSSNVEEQVFGFGPKIFSTMTDILPQTNKENHVHTIWRKLNLFAPELNPFFSVFLMTTVLYLLGMEADAATNE